MIFYKLDYSIEKTLKNALSREQKNLKDFVGQEFEQKEAKYVWEKILDHKWYLSESLERDIGMRVAAVDYIENFYQPPASRNTLQNTENFVFLLLILFLYLYSVSFIYLLFT